MVPPGAGGVVPGCLEDRADPPRGIFERTVRAAEDRRPSPRRSDESEQDAEGGRLAGSVRAQEPGDPAALDGEAEVVDRDRLAESLRESVDLDDRQCELLSARRC
jgi:hypothetical protein